MKKKKIEKKLFCYVVFCLYYDSSVLILHVMFAALLSVS